MLNLTLCKRIRKPNVWNTFTDPYNNLLYGILIQAIFDSNGYVGDNHLNFDGDDAVEFLQEYGETIMNHIKDSDRTDITKTERRYRKKHHSEVI